MKAARLAACVANDVRLQVRHGLYTVYGVVCALYILILQGLPPEAREALLPVFVFLDPSMAGFFFVGGIVMLERNDRVLSAVFTSPVGLEEYFASKVISLTLLALAASVVVSVGGVGLRFRPAWLFASVSLTSGVFTIVGLAAAARFRTLSRYMVWSAAYMLPFAIPVAARLAGLRSPLLHLIPSHGSLVLVSAAFEPAPPAAGDAAAAAASLLVWLALGWLWASRWFRRHVVERIGGEA